MKICTKCNREYDDGLNFCSKCGNTLIAKPQEYFCTSCGKSLGESFDRYCPYCGNMIVQHHSNSSEEQPILEGSKFDNETISYQDITNNTTVQHSAVSYFSKEYLFSLRGRRNRTEGLITGLILSSMMLAIIILGTITQSSAIWLFIIPLCLLVLWAQIANCVKRVHDFNKSGLWLLGCFVAYAIIGSFIKGAMPTIHNVISIIVPNLIFLPKGTIGANKYDT